MTRENSVLHLEEDILYPTELRAQPGTLRGRGARAQVRLHRIGSQRGQSSSFADVTAEAG